MMIFAIGIKDAFDVTVQRPHDADPGQGAAGLCNEDQRLHGSLPFGRGVFGLRQLPDVVGGVPQGEKPPAIRKRYWILKQSRPGQGKAFSKMGAGPPLGHEATPDRAVRWPNWGAANLRDLRPR